MTYNTIAQPNTPNWLDQEEYPFERNSFQSSAGTLNYVDTGEGDPIVMVHGNPGWSFEYRNVIKGTMVTNRCIAPDLIGFGFSDKPYEWDYLPKSHAAIFEEFMDSLNLDNITLVVNDWGGPIGLSYAIKHPEKIKKLVILNTFLWSVKDDPYYQKFSKRAGGGIGVFLTKNFNFFGKVIVKKVMGDKKKLTRNIHRHYYKHLSSPKERKGSYIFPREVVGSHEWLANLWGQKDKISSIPTIFVWGMRDIAFREQELNYWLENWEKSEVVRLEDVGHFPQEEAPAEVIKALQ